MTEESIQDKLARFTELQRELESAQPGITQWPTEEYTRLREQSARLVPAAEQAYEVLSGLIENVDPATAEKITQAMLAIDVALRRE